MQPLVTPQGSTPRGAANDAPSAVAFFLVPSFSMIALSAAIEPLHTINRLLGAARYRWLACAREA